MNDEIINKLKGEGFILNRDKETFSVRVITINGVVDSEKLCAVSEAAKIYGNGKTGLTSRMTLEIMGIKYENIEGIKAYLAERGLQTGGTGAKVRPIVSCKGTVCRFGLHDTFGLSEKIHDRFYDGWHGVVLPAKFKIGVGGCPNNCVKPQLNDFGIVGAAKGDACLKLYIGGKYGRTWRQGIPLEGLYTQEQALDILEKALNYYKFNANPKERFGDMIERIGFETVQSVLEIK